jgi:hypothetical protein
MSSVSSRYDRLTRAAAMVFISALLMALLAASARAADGYGGSPATATGPIGYDAAHSSYNGAIETVNRQDVFYFYLPAGEQPVHFAIKNTTPNDEAHSGAFCCQLEYGIADADSNILYTAPTGGIGPGESGHLDYTLAGAAKYYFYLRCARDGFGDPTCASDALPLNWHYSVSPTTSFTTSATGSTPPPSTTDPAVAARCRAARRDLARGNAAVRRDRRRVRRHNTRANRRQLARDQARVSATRRRVRNHCR